MMQVSLKECAVIAADLEPEVVSMGTCRALRIRRIGLTYLVENLKLKRRLDEDGEEVVEDDWAIVAISKGKTAREDAHGWMRDANADVMRIIEQDMLRAEVPNGSQARRAGQGHAQERGPARHHNPGA